MHCGPPNQNFGRAMAHRPPGPRCSACHTDDGQAKHTAHDFVSTLLNSVSSTSSRATSTAVFAPTGSSSSTSRRRSVTPENSRIQIITSLGHPSCCVHWVTVQLSIRFDSQFNSTQHTHRSNCRSCKICFLSTELNRLL